MKTNKSIYMKPRKYLHAVETNIYMKYLHALETREKNYICPPLKTHNFC